MKTFGLFFIPIIFMIACLTAAAQNTPKSAAEAFYKFNRSHSQNFNRQNIDLRKQYFSPELYRLFLNELKRESAYLKKNPGDKPYFSDGLPFQPLQEKCEDGPSGHYRGLVIKQEFQQAARSVVTATFAYPKPCRQSEPVVYTIGMIKSGGKWVIDDINYGEDTSLKQRLQRKEY